MTETPTESKNVLKQREHLYRLIIRLALCAIRPAYTYFNPSFFLLRLANCSTMVTTTWLLNCPQSFEPILHVRRATN